MLLNNQWVKEEIKREIKKYLETKENGNVTFQNLWESVKAVLRGKFIVINAYHKNKKETTRKVSNRKPNCIPQGTTKRRMSKVSRWKEITKIGAQISEIESKKTIEEINVTKSCFLRRGSCQTFS